MAWVKLDEQFTDHPKIMQAGPLASWLYVCGLTYCNRLLTNGHIPAGQLRKLADLDGADLLAATLVRVGLWDTVDGGYQVHDYLDYQPSKDQVMAQREATAIRQGRFRENKRNGVTNAVTTPVSNAFSNAPINAPNNAVPVPVPVPVPQVNSIARLETVVNAISADDDPAIAVAASAAESATPRAPKKTRKKTTARAYTTTFLEVWESYPTSGGMSKADAFDVYQEINPDAATHARILTSIEEWKQGRQFRQGFVMHLAKWLRARNWEVRVEPWSDEEPGRRKSAHEIAVAGLNDMFDALGIEDDQKETGRVEQNGVHGDVFEAAYHVAHPGTHPGSSNAVGRHLP